MRLRCLGVVLLLLSSSPAWGDGCYIPERAVRKLPEIAAQRAVLAWKDGTETLVIASALDSSSQELGWIIPIPSVPKTIEKASPGSLKTLDFCLQPKIIHDLSRVIVTLLVAAWIGNLLVGTWLFRRNEMGCLLTALTILGLLFSLMLPAVGTTGSMVTRTGNVQVEKTVAVGGYLVKILKAVQPADLNAWLAENHYAPLPAEAEPTVADYIARQWVFAAIKLTRAESGANTPHPIRIDFAAKEPVYPMKLTALAGGNPRVELFVIANDRLSCDVLQEEFCDRFTKDFNPYLHSTFDDRYYETSLLFNAASTHLRIGHSSICGLMWNGCVVTKLVGTLSATEMAEDLHFVSQPFTAYRQHFFSREGAREASWILLISAIAIWTAVSMARYRQRIVEPRGLRWYLGKRMLPAVALSALGAVILFAGLPKIAPAEVQISRGLSYWFARERIVGWVENALKSRPQLLEKSESEIADCLLSDSRSVTPLKNLLTGAELQVEDSPGNFTIEKRPGRILIRTYDPTGMVLVNVHRIPGKDNSNESGPFPNSEREPSD